MKPAAFDYLRAADRAEALAALAEAGEDGQVLAGGQSLMAMMNMRLLAPELLVDISRTEELRGIERRAAHLELGAAVTQAELAAWPDLPVECPLLALALPFVGHYQTRSRGTVCGSLCHADPSSELPLVLATLGGEVLLERSGGERRLSAGEFQTGMLSTALEPGELMTAARFPLAEAGLGYAFDEVATRHGDFAIVAIAVAAGPDGIRLGLGGLADRPSVVDWPDLDGSALDDALNELAWSAPIDGDPHASARYRRELVRRIGRRAVMAACGRREALGREAMT